jgi:DNA gyrase/topoisomerase IV subunit B
MPELIERGHIYIAQPPLYKVKFGKNERYIKDDAELNQLLLKIALESASLQTPTGEIIEGPALDELAKHYQVIQSIVDRLSRTIDEDALRAIASGTQLNLDTEKYKSTINKCASILEELKREFPDYEIKMFLIGGRYYEKKMMPKIILDKYTVIDNHLVGINDYLDYFNVNMKFDDENEYKEFLNILANSMFK